MNTNILVAVAGKVLAKYPHPGLPVHGLNHVVTDRLLSICTQFNVSDTPVVKRRKTVEKNLL